MTMAFAAGAVLPIALYLGMKGSWKELLNSLSFNSLKPISLESFWGNIITLVHKSSGIPIRLVPKFGVNGLHSDIFLNAPKVDLIWVVLSSLTVIWLLWRFWPSHYRNHIIRSSAIRDSFQNSKSTIPVVVPCVFAHSPFVFVFHPRKNPCPFFSVLRFGFDPDYISILLFRIS